MIIVLTMGRVASSSVQRSLQAVCADEVLHVHSVNRLLLEKQRQKGGRLNRSVLDGIKAAEALDRPSAPVNVVSLIRDPFKRNRSAAFSSFRAKYPKIEALREMCASDTVVTDWWQQFFKRRPMEWFDYQFRDVLGIDVYSAPFPGDQITFKNDVANAIVIESSLSDADKERALGDHLGISAFKMNNFNTSAREGETAKLYEEFCSRLPADPAYEREVYESRYYRHFYSR